MVKIHYPSDIEKLKKEYLNIFDIDAMNSQWVREEKLTGFKLVDLLTGDFDFLVDVFLWYKSQPIKKRKETLYKSIFDYSAKQPAIAEFFMNHNNGFDLCTCHYCNMAYINKYSKDLSYSDPLDFINNSFISEWRELFDSDSLSDIKLKKILDGRPYGSLEEFNRKKIFKKKLESYKCFSTERSYNHFDLDHLLPKSVCPIIGLSLFNFVPSCQVCNEKLKKAKELAMTKNDWLKISPTYKDSNFDNAVTIKLIPLEKCTTFFELKENNDNYRLIFETNGDEVYEEYISTLKLNDRYNFHKKIALRIMDLKERYPLEKRKEISRLLSGDNKEGKIPQYSESQIKEDILGEDFNKNRCFSKLLRDIIYKN